MRKNTFDLIKYKTKCIFLKITKFNQLITGIINKSKFQINIKFLFHILKNNFELFFYLVKEKSKNYLSYCEIFGFNVSSFMVSL